MPLAEQYIRTIIWRDLPAPKACCPFLSSVGVPSKLAGPLSAPPVALWKYFLREFRCFYPITLLDRRKWNIGFRKLHFYKSKHLSIIKYYTSIASKWFFFYKNTLHFCDCDFSRLILRLILWEVCIKYNIVSYIFRNFKV